MAPIPKIGKDVLWYERSLAELQRTEDPEHTLFLQITDFELRVIQFALFWLARIYGAGAVFSLAEKLHSLVIEQEFCNCPRCTEEREKKEEEE